MEFSTQIIIFIVGFLCGAGALAFLYFVINSKKEPEAKDHEDITSLKNHMQSIQQSLQNFNLAQDRIENTLIRGGAQQQGPWGEFVLKNILDSVGLRDGEEYETQKGFSTEEGRKIPDVIVHFTEGRDVIIDSKVSLTAWDEYVSNTDEVVKAKARQRHITSVKEHIKSLAKKHYQKIKDLILAARNR